MEAEVDNKLAAVLEGNVPYLRELKILVKIFENAETRNRLSADQEFTCLVVFAEGIGKLNNALGMLSLLGCKKVAKEDVSAVVEAFAKLNDIATPLLRQIFEYHGYHWVNLDAVIEHGHNYARSWTEVVLQTAEQFAFVSKNLDTEQACEILYSGGYESGKVQCHLELEFERAGKVLDAGGGRLPENHWPVKKEIKARSILQNTPSMTVKTFCRELELSDAIGGQLFHHIRGTVPRKRNRN